MLPCGEDLGMVPDCVGGVMRQEHILSLEIQRMPKAFGQAFDGIAAVSDDAAPETFYVSAVASDACIGWGVHGQSGLVSASCQVPDGQNGAVFAGGDRSHCVPAVRDV